MTAVYTQLTDTIATAPQIAPGDLPSLAAAGFRMIVNNRPDGEDPRQPAGAAIESAARTAGMDYRAVPVGHAGVGPVEIAAMRQALADAKGPVLAYCRSGTRSTFVWAMAAAANGEDPAIIAVSAARAGHDVRPLLG